MPPLTRQRTLESVLSWWSDSNPSGATINLHAATKPLMKLMYHRQALGFVKRNRGLPMSPETLEIYWSYLSWKYVSTSTKLAILEELITRARSEEDARVLIHSNIVHKTLELFRSSPLMRSSLTHILRHLANHRQSSTAPFGALLRDTDVHDIGLLSDFLSEITASQVSAFVKRNRGVSLSADTVEIYWSYVSWKYVSSATKIAIVEELKTRALSEQDAWVLLHSNMVYGFLRSTSYFDKLDLRSELERILRNLASHSKSTSAAVAEPIVALLRDSDVNEVGFAFELLRSITLYSSEGAEGVVAASALHYLLDGLGSRSASVRKEACYLTEALARHESTAAAVIDLNPCKQLVALSSAADTYEALVASYALIAIANWPDGAEAVVVAQVLDHVPKWFASSDVSMCKSACRLLANLARHKSTAGAVTDPKLCAQLVNILELDAYDYFFLDPIVHTLEALASIAKWQNGAEAVVAAKALDHLTKLLVSRWDDERKSTCDLLAALARHEPTVQAVARAVPRKRLVALLRDNFENVRESARKALQALDNYLASAQAPMEAPGELNVL